MEANKKRKLKLIHEIVDMECKGYSYLTNKKTHPRYKKILVHTDMEELMKKDIHTLLKRKETLNNREALSPEDIKKIFQEKKVEAISAFNWNNLMHNEVGFQVVEELKKQIKQFKEEKEVVIVKEVPSNTTQNKDIAEVLKQVTTLTGTIKQMAEEISQIKEKLQELQVLQQLDGEQDEIQKIRNDEINMDQNDELKQLMEDVGINYEPTDYTETEEEEMFQ